MERNKRQRARRIFDIRPSRSPCRHVGRGCTSSPRANLDRRGHRPSSAVSGHVIPELCGHSYFVLYTVHLDRSAGIDIVSHMKLSCKTPCTLYFVLCTLYDIPYVPSSTGGIRSPKTRHIGIRSRTRQGASHPRYAATALGHHVAVRPGARAACHSSEAPHQQLSAESFPQTIRIM